LRLAALQTLLPRCPTPQKLFGFIRQFADDLGRWPHLLDAGYRFASPQGHSLNCARHPLIDHQRLEAMNSGPDAGNYVGLFTEDFVGTSLNCFDTRLQDAMRCRPAIRKHVRIDSVFRVGSNQRLPLGLPPSCAPSRCRRQSVLVCQPRAAPHSRVAACLCVHERGPLPQHTGRQSDHNRPRPRRPLPLANRLASKPTRHQRGRYVQASGQVPPEELHDSCVLRSSCHAFVQAFRITGNKKEVGTDRATRQLPCGAEQPDDDIRRVATDRYHTEPTRTCYGCGELRVSDCGDRMI
jgi:hypothetical protein